MLLLAVALAAGVVSWAVMRVWDSRGTLPGVPRLAPITLLLIAVALFAIALGLRTRLRHQRERLPTARGVDPHLAARALMLAKACSLVGALVVGGYGGYAAYLVHYLSIESYQRLAIQCGLSVAAGLLVVGAGLFLEAVLRVPRPPDGEQDGDHPDSD
jgi:hypothetical protein